MHHPVFCLLPLGYTIPPGWTMHCQFLIWLKLCVLLDFSTMQWLNVQTFQSNLLAS